MEGNAIKASRRTETPPNLPVVYANGFQIALGPMDVQIFLLETMPLSQTEVVDKRLLSVAVTPEALKLLAENLPKYVESYEQQFGKIRDTASTQEAAKIIATPQ